MTTATLLLAILAATAADRDDLPGVTLLDFHSEACGPCQAMRPAIAQLKAQEYSVRSIDTDREPNLAARYRITAVPTFIVVDDKGRELGRIDGARPAIELANLYNEAVSKVSKANARADRPAPTPAVEPGEEDPAEEESTGIPRPWQTAVRICISEPPFIEYGSGTIISSTPEETIILTCAHIFKKRNGTAVPPAQFRQPIRIDLFDGVIRGTKPAMLRWSKESFPGQAIDYDVAADVGLIRFRPGKKLPYSPVVPATWKPKVGLDMDTVGCPGGQDATAWSTQITRYEEPLKTQGRPYHAIECVHAPQQGRSGGGLFTKDGRLAGVCDFADYDHQRGLYASPTSIYKLLDRNNLSLCYAPDARPSKGGALLASNGDRRVPKIKRNSDGDIMMPTPAVAGVKLPPADSNRGRSMAWQSPETQNGRRNPSQDPVVGAVSLAQGNGRPRTQARLQNAEDTGADEISARPKSTAEMRLPAGPEDPFEVLDTPSDPPPAAPRRASGGAWKVVPKNNILPAPK